MGAPRLHQLPFVTGEGAYFAPELGNVWVRYGGREHPEGAKMGLKAWMRAQPTRVPGRRQMPQFNLTEQELDDLIDFLEWVSRIDTQDGRPITLADSPELTYPKGDHIHEIFNSKLAYPYFVAALALFAVQVTVGVLAGTVYTLPNFLADSLPFHIIRMIHTNALIIWLLLGYFGAAYFLIPEESEREIHSPKIAWLQLFIFVFAALGAVVSYLMGIHEGREFLEQPLWVKILLVVAFLLFLYNVSMTVLKGRKQLSPRCCYWACGVPRSCFCLLSTIRTTSRSTKCTGGTWCISG